MVAEGVCQFDSDSHLTRALTFFAAAVDVRGELDIRFADFAV